MIKQFYLVILVSAILILSSQQDPCGTKPFCGRAVQFKDKNSFIAFLNRYPDNFFRSSDRFITLESPAPPAVPSAAPSAAPSAPSASRPSARPDFSQTNNQVLAVDEADIIKTDGTYIYTIANGIVNIVQARLNFPGPRYSVIARINLTSIFYPQDLFVKGTFLAVFGTAYEQVPIGNGKGGFFNPFFYRQKTIVRVFNLFYPPNPQLHRSYEFEGAYSFGRMTNGFVYLISNFGIYSRPRTIPQYTVKGGLSPAVTYDVPATSIFSYPDAYSYPSFTGIFSFNLEANWDNSVGHIILVIESSSNLYMSANNIYLASNRYFSGNAVFTGQSTDIHKVYANGLTLKPAADGTVVGYINNQYFMDEYQGNLRIATTATDSNFVPSNGVYVLDRNLNLLGSADGVARTQRIFAARFVGDRLYMVTFRQVDPFFVVDLSIPSLPRFVGELKIPGFSRYLHPYDRNFIIGIGQQANENGQQTGLKISLFNVTNVVAPTETASYVSSQQYSGSIAEWQSKAFLFSRERNLLVIPGYYYNFPGQSFNGAFVFKITRSSIRLRGLIDHSDNSQNIWYGSYVDRSLFIGDILFTRSQCKIRANSLNETIPDLRFVANIPLVCQ